MATRIPNFQDLGFGSRITTSGDRLILQDGSFNIVRKGRRAWDAYQFLIGMPPSQLAFVTFLFIIGINAIFACMFLAVGIEQLNGVPKGSWIDNFLYAFFFSVQTFTTVGYGGINPVGISANFVSSLCAMIGLISFALVTGLFFARFSRPRSHISFSKKAIISPYRGMQSFQFRIVNPRSHKIINLSARVSMTWLEKQSDGLFKREFANLPLERDQVVLFPLNWTIVHPIAEDSPMYGKTLKEMEAMRAEILVMISGFDESYNQHIHTNSSFTCKEIETGVKFKPMYTSSNQDATFLYLDDLNKVIPAVSKEG